MSDLKDRNPDGDGHDGHDDGHVGPYDPRELVHYVHDMLKSLETITAGRDLTELSRRIAAARKAARALLHQG